MVGMTFLLAKVYETALLKLLSLFASETHWDR